MSATETAWDVRSITSSLQSHPEFQEHEDILRCHDAETGLRAYIAIHSTKLGPSLGGVRMWPYDNEADAVTDVLRLSQAMSYKHAIAGTGRGGGKAVLLGDARTDKTPELFFALGRFVEEAKGRYITAEDVGICVEDLLFVARQTRHVSGLPLEMGGSGDPSPMTALGVYCGIVAALTFHRKQTFRDVEQVDLTGTTIAVQGLGHVGTYLCEHLHRAGATLLVADVVTDRVASACDRFGATACPPTEIPFAEADVFSPCALGGVLDADTIDRIGANVVAGAANNQLVDEQVGRRLHQRGIVYAPDYVLNAGGIINIAQEQPKYDADRARAKTKAIAETLWHIFERAQREALPTSEVANRLAQEKLAE